MHIRFSSILFVVNDVHRLPLDISVRYHSKELHS